MKTRICLLLPAIFSVLNGSAQTNVSGFISANTTWNLAGSPYIVVGNALLSSGYTLTINPGVVVKFNDSTALQIDGELIAIGSFHSRITFTSNQPNPAQGDWAKIHFPDTCVDAVFDTNGNYISGSTMQYCDVMYGGQLGFGEIHIERSFPYFNRCYIANSASSGLYCVSGSLFLDSSAVKNCIGSGINFNARTLPPCSVRIHGDTLENNMFGGIQLNGFFNCSPDTKEISNCYFLSNHNWSAISCAGAFNIRIAENYFSGNTSLSQCGIISSSSAGGSMSDYIIECNQFINNQTYDGGVIDMQSITGSQGLGIIRNNYFEDNYSTGLASCININCAPADDLYFLNNYFLNNTSLNGSCCRFLSSAASTPRLHIKQNEFNANSGSNILFIDGYQSSSGNYNFLDMKLNNFLNSNSPIVLYNNVSYGSPNLYIDSNYWGSTSAAYIDSVIYDYFDFANKSVVYYMPYLMAPAPIDTACPVIITVGINTPEIESEISTTIYPNPFTTQATISFNKEVYNATFSLYNLLGEKVADATGINGESYLFNRGNLRSGVYVFEVSEGKSIWRGKAVVY